MKDIIYFDSTAINSLLAQAGNGLIGKVVSQVQTSLSEGEGTAEGSELSGELNALNVAKGQASSNKSENKTNNYTKTNSDLEEIAYHDYALDILMSNLNFNTDANNGDIIFIENTAQLFDFSKLERIMDENIISIFDQNKKFNQTIENQIQNLKDSKKNSHIKNNNQKKNKIDKSIRDLESMKKSEESNENFKNVYNLGKFGNALFPNTILIKLGNYISICPKENVRLNDATATLYNEVPKTAKCLAIKLYQRNEGYIKKDEDGEIVQLSTDTIAASSPTMMMDILLDNSELSKKDDYIIKPIAIYYDID